MKRTIYVALGVLLALALVTACGGGGGRKFPAPIINPPQPPPTTNEVSGTLTDPYGNPVSNASLLLNGEDVGIATDASGSFVLPSGLVRANERFRLGVRQQGVLLGEREFQLGEDWRLDWQLGEPDPNGGTVNGLVVDADTEEPVPDAILVLFTSGIEEESENGWAAVTMTDEAGQYEFTGVPPGAYHLLVFAAAYRLQMLSLTVEAEKTTQLIVRLEPRAHTPPAEGYLVSGRVTDANTGEGIAGAFIQGNSDSGWYYIMEEPAEVAPHMPPGTDYEGGGSRGGPDRPWEPPIYQETTSDAEGYFEFPDPFNGLGVYLTVNHEDYMPFSGYFPREADGAIELEIELTPIVPINISGRVTDTEGTPIENAYLEFIYVDPNFYGDNYAIPVGARLSDLDAEGLAYAQSGDTDAALPGAPPAEGGGGYDQSHDSLGMARYRYQMRENRGAAQLESMPFGYYSATTDENGNYDLGEIPSGYYSIFVNAYGYLSYYCDQELTESRDDVNFELEAVPVGCVSGRVTDDAGNPIDEALVNATQPNVDPFTFTDANGEFVLDNVPAGTWRVGAYKEGYEARAVTVEIVEDVIIELNFSLPRAQEPPPTEFITFTGMVLDGTTSEPLADADLVAVAVDDSYYTYVRSGSTGDYTMLLPAGEYNVLVQHEGYYDAYLRVWVDPEWPEFDFYLWPIGSGTWGPWGGIADGTIPPPETPPPPRGEEPGEPPAL